jgi:hypothetical protein
MLCFVRQLTPTSDRNLLTALRPSDLSLICLLFSFELPS